MNRPCRLSENAKDYLSVFQGILEEMEREMTGAALTDSISQNFIADNPALSGGSKHAAGRMRLLQALQH